MSTATKTIPARRLSVAAIMIALLVSLAGCTSIPGDPIGQTIADLSSKVQDILAKAGQTANGTLITAASSVQQTIDAAAAAFGDQFTKGSNEVDAAVKQDLDQISNLVDQLGSTAADVLAKTSNEAAALLVQIGIGSNTPLLKSYGPRLTTAAAAANGLPLHLHGVFPKADQPGYAPKLIINGVEQPNNALTSNDLTDLTFRLPPQTFAEGVPGITSPDIAIQIPYAKGHIFKTIMPGIFHIEIATIPNSPVQRMSITRTIPGTTTQVQHLFQTEDVYLSSLDCKEHADDKTLTPHAGWAFDPSSVTPVVDPHYPKGPSGTWEGPTVVNRSPSSISLHAKTTPACFLAIIQGGRTYYHYTYVELEPVTSAPKTDVEPLNLGWGDQLSADVPQSPGSWHLDVTLWNGVKLTAPPTVNNPWVTMRNLGTKVAYSAADLNTLSLSDFSPTS